jgi:hypothetical protein
MGSGDPSWRRSSWFKALAGYRLGIEAVELDKRADHHQADYDIRETYNWVR